MQKEGNSMQINYVNSVLVNRKVPMEAVIGTNVFVALRIKPIPEYKDGKRTGNIIGYAYECVDEIAYKHFTIKIKGQTEPIISNDELQQLRENEKVMLEFKNPMVFMYYNRSALGYEDSYSADDVMIVSD